MTTKSAVTSDSTENAAEVSTEDLSTLDGGGKRLITPAERWMLICKNVYARAQKRGFVGGNPLQDLAEAEQETDAAYETDFNSVFSLTSTEEITEQLKSLFACYGFDQEHLENLLDGHQAGLERLAAMNRELLASNSGIVAKQAQLLEDVATEAVKTLQSLNEGRLRPEGAFNVAKLSLQAFDNALAGFQGFTKSVSVASARRPATQALLQGAVAIDYQGHSATQLMDAPVTALKGISDSLAEKLDQVFGVSTIREMAVNKHVAWARGVALLATAEPDATDSSSPANYHRRVLQAVADSPIREVRNIGDSQARLLKEEFGIETAGDLGNNRLFSTARAIVMLAESED